jgi:transposase-like protein
MSPVGHCPSCRSEQLRTVTNGIETNFLCDACGSCWNVSFARVSRVDPVTCPGCAHARRCVGREVVPAGASDSRA